MTASGYHPSSFRALTYHDAVEAVRRGSDTPRDYLERCLATIAEREPVVRAYVVLNEDDARAAADASTARWRAGQPLSPIDGMPVSIKDLLETRDMPTQMGCEAYAGHFPRNDNAAVRALREAGAVVLGKTVTAELGGAHPGPTTNPFDASRTPGGSSSGSAAAVAARMVPAAIGSQVGGSIIRPAAYCGNFALKPTQGAINRGERQTTSMSTHGPHAGSLEDMWQVAIEIARRAGGDRGARALCGPDSLPAAQQPLRLLVLQTDGWARIDAPTRQAFETLLERIQGVGVTLLRRDDEPLLEVFEQAIAGAGETANDITAWENHWAHRNLVDQHGERVSERARKVLARAESMSVDDYQQLLLRREAAQRRHAALAPLADAAITLSCPGPATPWAGDVPGQPLAPRPTGDPVFNAPSSMLFAPCVTVPMLAVGGLPVGVQFMGQMHEDARMTGLARWLWQSVEPVVL